MEHARRVSCSDARCGDATEAASASTDATRVSKGKTSAPPTTKGEEERPGSRVFFVPGLVSAGLESALLARRLRRRGLTLDVFPHGARREHPKHIAERLAEQLRAEPGLHLIGHSMGGLIVLAALDAVETWTGRAVLLGSPVAGSAAARWLLNWPGGSRILGAAGEWLAAPPVLRTHLKQVVIIAGTHHLGLGRMLGLAPGPSDGVVHVDETKLAGTTTKLCPTTHLGLLLDPRVAEFIAEFIRSGTFLPVCSDD